MSFSFPNISNSYRIRGTNNSFGNGWQQGTFMAWARFRDLNADCCLFHIGSAFEGGTPILFWRDDISASPTGYSNCLAFMVTCGGTEVRSVSSTNSINTTSDWFHIAGSFNTTSSTTDDRKPRIYINGDYNVASTLPANHTQNSSLSNTTTPLSIARPNGYLAARHIYGWMEDIRVYDRQLSADEIRTIYKSQGKDSIVDGLVVRTMSNLGPSGIDVPATVPDISPPKTNLITEKAAAGNLLIDDQFTLSAKRTPIHMRK